MPREPLTPEDPDETIVGGSHSAYSPEPYEDPDQTFVSVKEPVLPWPEPQLPPAPAPPQPPQPPAPEGRAGGRSPRRTALWIALGAAVVVVLVVVGLLVVRSLNRTTHGPQHAVTDYLDALTEGDANAALALWHPDTSRGEDVLLDQEVYAAAKNRPNDYEVTDVTTHGDTAEVQVDLRVAGEKQSVSFELEQGPRQKLFFHTWKITQAPEQQVTLQDPTAKVKVNGVDVDLSDESGAAVGLAVLPGDYKVVAPSSRASVPYVERTVSAGPGMTKKQEAAATIAFPSSAARTAIDTGAAPGAGGQRPKGAKPATAAAGKTALLSAPSGNIGCDLGTDSAGCGVKIYRSETTGPGGEDGKWWFDLRSPGTPQQSARSSRAGFEGDDASPQILDYGESVYHGDDVCVSEKTGMTCWNTDTGHGVYLSRWAARTF